MGLRELFVDMNAFFASVEQQLRPELRGRPVVVVPVLADTTCCIAASYEAKRLGIKTGTQVGKAKKLCPSLRIVEARPDLYVRCHHRILETVESCLPVKAVHSIDEVSCSLRGAEREPNRAIELARLIKQALRDGVGEYVRCSIGIAPNRFLAKVAADMQKPDGLTVLAPQDLPHRLYGLPLIDLPGIGPRLSQRLHHHGIRTVQQLCEQSKEDLIRLWRSVLGQQWWHWLRGDEVDEPPTHRRSLGHSHVLPPEWRSEEGARAILIRLIHKAGARLRQLNYWACRLTVHVSFLQGHRWKAKAAMELCQDTQTMLEVFSSLWLQCPPGRPLQVGVILDRLAADGSAPIPLFPAEQNRMKLARTIDRLNAKFGSNTIYFGGMHGTRNSAPSRIAFTHIPKLDIPV